MAEAAQKSDLLQGTLDVLILRVVALGPIHGSAIAQRLPQMSRAVLQVQQLLLSGVIGQDVYPVTSSTYTAYPLGGR